MTSGSLTGAAALAAKENFKAYTGESYDDFVYDGKFHSIDPGDTVLGFKDGGAISKMGGSGVSINNLIIYESGDPNKTFAMGKSAVKAALK